MRLQEYAGGETPIEHGLPLVEERDIGKLLQAISTRVAAGRRRAVANLFEVAERYEALRPLLTPAQLRTYLAHAQTFPRLTLRMLARLQEFPDEWQFAPPPRWKASDGFDSRGDMPLGSPMPTFRQIANAFPPPLARAMGIRIRRALTGYGPNLEEALRQSYNVKRPRFDMRDAYRGRQRDDLE